MLWLCKLNMIHSFACRPQGVNPIPCARTWRHRWRPIGRGCGRQFAGRQRPGNRRIGDARLCGGGNRPCVASMESKESLAAAEKPRMAVIKRWSACPAVSQSYTRIRARGARTLGTEILDRLSGKASFADARAADENDFGASTQPTDG
jgi:hypothetical protein